MPVRLAFVSYIRLLIMMCILTIQRDIDIMRMEQQLEIRDKLIEDYAHLVSSLKIASSIPTAYVSLLCLVFIMRLSLIFNRFDLPYSGGDFITLQQMRYFSCFLLCPFLFSPSK